MNLYERYSHLYQSLEQLDEGTIGSDAVLKEINENFADEKPNICFNLISYFVNPPEISEGFKQLIQKLYLQYKEKDDEAFFLSTFFKYLNSYKKVIVKLSNIFPPDIIASVTDDEDSLAGVFAKECNKEKLIYFMIQEHNYMPEILDCLQIDYDKLELLFRKRAIVGSIRCALIEDDVQKLIELETDPSFNKNMRLYSSDFDIAKGVFKPIEYAVLYGSVKCFKQLMLSYYVDDPILISDPSIAIQGGNLEIIKLLMDKGYDFKGIQPLITAIMKKKNEILSWLIDRDLEFVRKEAHANILIKASMGCFNFEAFKLLIDSTKPIYAFSSKFYESSNCSFFYTYIFEMEKKKGTLDTLIRDISMISYSWFKEKWFPLNEINPDDMFQLICNSITASAPKNLEVLLNLNPILSKQQELFILENGRKNFFDTIVKFNRFHPYISISITDLIHLVETGSSKALAYIEIESICNQIDEEGNNLLQHLFSKTFLTPDHFDRNLNGREIGRFVAELAKKLDPNYKNNAGETAADILQKRPYNQATLIFHAQYRISVESFPYQNIPICSFKFTKRNYYHQPFYACHTCNLENGLGVCEACVSKCHKGHEVEYLGIRNCFCDCCVQSKHAVNLFEREMDELEKEEEKSSSDSSSSSFDLSSGSSSSSSSSSFLDSFIVPKK